MASTPEWKKSSPQLIALFDEIAPRGDPIVQKMFGWPCCLFNGNLFLGFHRDNIIFRLSAADLEKFLHLEGAAEFEPMPGRKMKGYGILSDPLTRDGTSIGKERCLSELALSTIAARDVKK
jgi:hypothetical protein